MYSLITFFYKNVVNILFKIEKPLKISSKVFLLIKKFFLTFYNYSPCNQAFLANNCSSVSS